MIKKGWVLKESFDAKYGMPTLYRDKIHTYKDQIEVCVLPAEDVEKVRRKLRSAMSGRKDLVDSIKESLEILEGQK